MKYIKTFEQFINEGLDTFNVAPGTVVQVSGQPIKVLEIYKQINGSVIEFKGESEDGSEASYRFDSGCNEYVKESEDGLSKAGHAALGMKQVRIVISGPGNIVEKNADKILKFIEKADPNSKCDFYDKTGKIVGAFAKAKMDNIKRDLKAIDSKIKIEIKNQVLR